MDDRARNRFVVLGGFGLLAAGAAAVVGWQVYEGRLPAPPPPAEAPAKKKPAGKKALGSLATPAKDGLHMPPAKRCLAGPSEVEGDEGMAASAGLDYDSVASSMRSFVPNTLRCVPEGGIAGTVSLSITAGCDGRVASVAVNDPGGLPSDVVDCVKDTLRYAEFPAHDMPDGYAFEYPLTFSR
jgi:hypothetical protein